MRECEDGRQVVFVESFNLEVESFNLDDVRLNLDDARLKLDDVRLNLDPARFNQADDLSMDDAPGKRLMAGGGRYPYGVCW